MTNKKRLGVYQVLKVVCSTTNVSKKSAPRPLKHQKKNTFKHEDAKNMKITKIFYYSVLCSSCYLRNFISSCL